MAEAVILTGQKPNDNHIGEILTFDVPSTWTVTGTGSASISTAQYAYGESSLYLENTAPTMDLLASNTTQSTIIPKDGDYYFSFHLFKTLVDTQLTGEIQIFKDAVLFNTVEFTLGSTVTEEDVNNKWIKYGANQKLSFTKGQEMTIKVQLDGIPGTILPSTFLWIDGLMHEIDDKGNRLESDFLKSINNLYNKYTGWATYVDTAYTTGSPFTATDGVKTNLPNNKGTLIESQLPIDITTFYDGSTIQGKNGDGLNIVIEFECRPTTAASNVRLQVAIDIGGSVGEIYPRDFTLSKGSGVEHYYLSSFNVYTLDTWETNGGTIKVTAVNDDIEIYNVRYVITRTHKAK